MTNTTGSCGSVIKAKGSACILPIKAFTVGEALTSGQWRCYNGGMYVVCKDFDGKLNYPDSKFFKGPFGLEDVLNGAIQPCAGDMLCLCPPIWGACNLDGSHCIAVYGLRACAWDYDPELGEYRLYTSLKADNHTKPYEGSKATPKTWDGGYDVCGYLNRPVAKDLDGKLYYPGDKDSIFCGVQCSAVDNPDFTYVGGKLRVNFPAPPTPVRIVAIDDSGTQTTITLSDGTVISGPEIDKDDYVVGFTPSKNAAGENALTITMKSGATHQVTLPANTVVSITDLTNAPNYENGTIQINSSDGADTTLDITHEDFWPTAWARVGTTNNQGANGDKPPNISLNGGKSHLTGKFAYDGNGHLVVPKNGTYRVMYRPAVIGNQQILYPNGNRCLVKLMINGTQFSQLIMQDHAGTTPGEELNDFRDHDIALNDSLTLPPNCILTIDGASNIVLDLNGSTLVSDSFNPAIFVSSTETTQTSHITIKNGEIHGYGTAVYVHRNITATELITLKNDPEGFFPTIQSTAPHHITFENINIKEPKGTGFYVWVSASYVTINNCSVNQARGLGVYLDTGSHHNTVSNSTFSDGGHLNPDGSAKTGRGRREAIAIDGSYSNTISGNTITGNAYGGIHLYSNCGEHVSTDPTYIPRIFDAEYNEIDGNYIANNGTAGGAMEIGKRVDWNLESWDCAKPVYQQYLTFKYYWDNSGFNTIKNTTGDGEILVRTDNNTLIGNQQAVTVNSVVRSLVGDPLVNNSVS